MGREDRAPSEVELEAMRELVRKGMREGAFGLSSGLFYVPGTYAETEEVIELARAAAEFGPAIYDTHDRDLGAAYPSYGYLASIREGIRIGEESGLRVIFSHFNAQGRANYGRAPEGAALIEAARAPRRRRRRGATRLHRHPVEPERLHDSPLGLGGWRGDHVRALR